MHAEACKNIERHQLEETFYIVDLGNVLRMYKVMDEPCSRWGLHRCTCI